MSWERGREGERLDERIVLIDIKFLYKSNYKRVRKIICFIVNMYFNFLNFIFLLRFLRGNSG